MDDTQTPRRYIERVSGKGYRLIAPVTPLPDTAPAPLAYPPWRSRRLAIGTGAAALLALGIALAIGFITTAQRRATPPAPENALVMLPITLDAALDSANRYLASGITDTLRTRLAALPVSYRENATRVSSSGAPTE